MARIFEVRGPETGGSGPPVQLDRPEKPTRPPPLLLLLGFPDGTIFGHPLVGTFPAFGYWLPKRLDS